jgi:uncharacterized membrane protein/protein-disulfide isomerase
MPSSLTLNGARWPRALSFVAGAGMMTASVMTVRHFFMANYPETIFQGSFCDISAFFNCDSSAYSVISQIGGVPLGYFGLVVGALVALGAVFPSQEFERTNKSLAALNVLGVVALFLFSVLWLKSLCLFCAGYYVFSAISFVLFWKYGIDRDASSLRARYLRPSWAHAAVFAVVLLAGAYSMRLFHDAKKQAQSGGVAARIVEQYFGLPTVPAPSVLSPYWSVRSTERFEDAPIQVIEYGDFLCSDCVFLFKQFQQLKQEFAGKLNIVFQFFPLEARCNRVVEKDIHPGACELSYIAAQNSEQFAQMHDEIFANFPASKKPEWRRELARRYAVEAAYADEATKKTVERILSTGAEYEKTSEKYAHGIRSTPTLIINNRMIIGTLPYVQLRAIFQALVERAAGQRKFIENWEPTRPR